MAVPERYDPTRRRKGALVAIGAVGVALAVILWATRRAQAAEDVAKDARKREGDARAAAAREGAARDAAASAAAGQLDTARRAAADAAGAAAAARALAAQAAAERDAGRKAAIQREAVLAAQASARLAALATAAKQAAERAAAEAAARARAEVAARTAAEREAMVRAQAEAAAREAAQRLEEERRRGIAPPPIPKLAPPTRKAAPGVVAKKKAPPRPVITTVIDPAKLKAVDAAYVAATQYAVAAFKRQGKTLTPLQAYTVIERSFRTGSVLAPGAEAVPPATALARPSGFWANSLDMVRRAATAGLALAKREVDFRVSTDVLALDPAGKYVLVPRSALVPGATRKDPKTGRMLPVVRSGMAGALFEVV